MDIEQEQQQQAAATAAAVLDFQQQLNNLQAQLAQYHNANVALEARNTQLQQLLQQQQEQQAHAAQPPVQPEVQQPAAVNAGHRSVDPVLAALLRELPTQFAGTKQDRKYVDNWLDSIKGRFQLMQPPPTEEMMLRYATTCLVRDARTWWRTHRDRLTTWDLFEDAFLKQYSLPNKIGDARTALHTLTQGRRSVNDYIDTFNSLHVELPDVGEEMAKHFFVSGLKPSLSKEVRMRDDGHTLDEVMLMAAKLESLENEGKAIAAAFSRPPPALPRRPNHHPVPPPPRYGGPTPMELGAMGMQRGTSRHVRFAPNGMSSNRARLSAGTRQVLHSAGGCVFCRATTHTSDSCPHKRNSSRPAAPRPAQQGNGRRRRM